MSNIVRLLALFGPALFIGLAALVDWSVGIRSPYVLVAEVAIFLALFIVRRRFLGPVSHA
jgi:hypothetical protein